MPESIALDFHAQLLELELNAYKAGVAAARRNSDACMQMVDAETWLKRKRNGVCVGCGFDWPPLSPEHLCEDCVQESESSHGNLSWAYPAEWQAYKACEPESSIPDFAGIVRERLDQQYRPSEFAERSQ